VWGKERLGGTSGAGRGLGAFEEEIRRLLGKRWVATGGVPLRTNTNTGPPSAGTTPGSGANSGASTPFGHHGSRSALGNTVFVEEDEDDLEEMERGGDASGGRGDRFSNGNEFGGRLRSHTVSTAADTIATSSVPEMLSTPFTTPDLDASPNGTSTPTSTTMPLTPVVAMPTADAEAQIGLAKVAEPDVDAFMTYAAIVPEYCRLEGMLVKALV
jgi:xylulokinase